MTTPQTTPSEEAKRAAEKITNSITIESDYYDSVKLIGCDIESLAPLIDAEFAALREKLKSYEKDAERRNGIDAIYAGMRVQRVRTTKSSLER